VAMPEPEEIPINAKFVYNKPQNYDTFYVNGTLGGITARGEMILNFFFEHSDIPKEERDVLINGKIVPKPEKESFPEIQRDVKACIVLTPAHAKGMAEFILDLVKQYDASHPAVNASDKQENQDA
jgi:hypothetical protein